SDSSKRCGFAKSRAIDESSSATLVRTIQTTNGRIEALPRTWPAHIQARIIVTQRCRVRMGGKIDGMAKLTLVYGMRLLPSEEIEEVGEAQVKLKNGSEARVSLHIVEGSKDDIEKQLRQSIDAFFDLYPEI